METEAEKQMKQDKPVDKGHKFNQIEESNELKYSSRKKKELKKSKTTVVKGANNSKDPKTMNQILTMVG